MSIRAFHVVAILMLAAALSLGAQPCGITELGVLPARHSSFASGVSADGSVVVGTSSGNFFVAPDHAFRWTSTGGMQDLGVLPGRYSSSASDVSNNGSVVVGSSAGFDSIIIPSRAFRWSETDGMLDLGVLPGRDISGGSAVSADGTVVVGSSLLSSNAYGTRRAFRWTAATGMLEIGTLPGMAASLATDVSGSGDVVVGNSITQSRSRAFRWTATDGLQDIGSLAGDTDSRAFAISSDGLVVVGDSYSESGFHRAFRWTAAEGMQDLGFLPGGSGAIAIGVSMDGTVVVGVSDSANGARVFRWTSEYGMRAIDSLLEVGDVSADGSTLVGYADHVDGGRALRWMGSFLLFRESDNASWTWGPDRIPGWDHVGIVHEGRVYESHPPYPIPYPACQNGYFDPASFQPVQVNPDNGVQWQHTRGSYQHDSCGPTSSAGNLEIPLLCDFVPAMVSFIQSQANAPFLNICDSSLDISCLRDQLQPNRQKGRVGGAYTCVGLVERAAEEAGMNGGQGLVPNSLESFLVPNFGEVPCLSPEVLSWFAESGFSFADGGALFGLFDPVDFVLTDPLGRRLGHTAALGTLNEIPNARYTGSGTIEQFLIPSPVPGLYSVQIVGVGGIAGAAIGGTVPGQVFERALAAGEMHELNITIPEICFSDYNTDGNVDQGDIDYLVDVVAGGPNPTGIDPDFTRDGNVDQTDIDALINVVAGGPCP